jgi:hypothetical protein
LDIRFDHRGQQSLGPIQLVGIIHKSRFKPLTFLPYTVRQSTSLYSTISAQTIAMFE